VSIQAENTGFYDFYPEETKDGKHQAIILIIAILEYEDKNMIDLTNFIDSALLSRLETAFEEKTIWDVRFHKGFIDEADIKGWISEIDKETGVDDRVGIIWIGHGFYDFEKRYGALATSKTVNNTNGLDGEYISTDEIARIFEALGLALDFFWVMACYSKEIFSHPLIDEWIRRDGAVVFYYKEEINWFLGEDNQEKQIKKLCELLEDDYVVDVYAESLGLEFKNEYHGELYFVDKYYGMGNRSYGILVGDYLDLKTASIKENEYTELPPISDDTGGGSSSLGIWSETR